MKALFALLFTLSLASAAYNSTWAQCGAQNESFTPHSVIATKDPKTENDTLVAACGVVNSQGWTIFDSLTVHGSDELEQWTAIVPYKHMVSSGLPFCLNYTDDFKNAGKEDVTLRISAISAYGNEVGCVDIVLQYIEEKFLAFRK